MPSLLSLNLIFTSTCSNNVTQTVQYKTNNPSNTGKTVILVTTFRKGAFFTTTSSEVLTTHNMQYNQENFEKSNQQSY
jgi:cytochrome c-type biogenesis protein CcmE